MSSLASIVLGVALEQRFLLVVAVCLLVTVVLPFGWAVTTPGGIGSYSTAVIAAGPNTVIFVYPDAVTTLQLPLKTAGPPPVYYALVSDWTAMGILIGVTSNPQYETLDTNAGAPIFINLVTGQPSPVPPGPIVPIAGPLVNNVVHWVEYGANISPVYYSEDPGSPLFPWLPGYCTTPGPGRCFLNRATGAELAWEPNPAPSYTPDFFVIYTIVDAAGNTYYMFYGFRYRGTLAAAHQLLAWVQGGNLGSQTQGWQVWRWDDKNGDGIVNASPTDTYTLIASG